MEDVRAWIAANPALFVALWGAFTAGLSWAVKYAKTIPRLHALGSLFASLGIDLPKLMNSLYRIVTGDPPPAAPPTFGSRKPANDPPVPPVCRRSVLTRYVGPALVSGSLALPMAGYGAVLVTEACTAQEAKTATSGVLTGAQIACELAQIELGTNDPVALETACNIEAALGPELQKLLAAQALADKMVAATRALDAGRRP